MAKVEISAELLAKVVASDPMAGWQPKNAFKPTAVELINSTPQCKRATPTVEDIRLELKVAGIVVKTYASNLMALWNLTGSKEDLFTKGSTDKMKVLNPKLKVGYEEDPAPRDPNFRFKMVVASK